MGEFDHISWIRQRTPPHPQVAVGPGDDCAVIQQQGESWLVTTDMLLEGSHFLLSETTPRQVGRKALAVNLSDIAAMGGTPVAAFVSLGLPRGNTEAVAEELYLGMREVADAFGTAIAGGDTNTWTCGLVISVTLLGTAGRQGPILRSGAKPGDWLLVTGDLGGSILGKHLDFTPRIREAQEMQDHAPIHAMIDISDGLAADVNHICEESRCGAVLFAERIPISAAACRLSGQRGEKPPLHHALSDGEDFELALAVAPADGERLVTTQPIAGITLSHVGIITSESGLILEENGQRRPLKPLGYVHPFE